MDPPTKPAADEGTDASSLVLRVDALLDEIAAVQKELFTLATRPGSLPSTLAALFTGPARALRRVDPEMEITPGIRINFDRVAELEIIVEPKPLRAARAGAYPNTVELVFARSSAWLALEVAMDWSDLATGSHYQLSIYAVPDRRIGCRAAVRLRRNDGTYFDHFFAKAELGPTEEFFLSSGAMDMGVLDGIDMDSQPKLLLLFDAQDVLRLRFDQLVASFD